MSNRVGSNKAGATSILGLTATDELRNLRADRSTHTLQTIEYEHHEIHAGSHYFYTDANTINAATTDCVDYLIITPDTEEESHFVFEGDGSAISGFYMREGVTASSSDYTQATVFNSNRNFTDVATLSIFYIIGSNYATSDYGGTQIYEYYGGASSSQSKTPTSNRSSYEIVLKRNTKYLFRVVSGTATNLCNVEFTWYEHTPKT